MKFYISLFVLLGMVMLNFSFADNLMPTGTDKMFYSKEQACKLGTGLYKHRLEVSRTNKFPETYEFYKGPDYLVYIVNIWSDKFTTTGNTTIRNTENVFFYKYDCNLNKPFQLYANLLTGSALYGDLIFGDNNYYGIVFNKKGDSNFPKYYIYDLNNGSLNYIDYQNYSNYDEIFNNLIDGNCYDFNFVNGNGGYLFCKPFNGLYYLKFPVIFHSRTINISIFDGWLDLEAKVKVVFNTYMLDLESRLDYESIAIYLESKERQIFNLLQTGKLSYKQQILYYIFREDIKNKLSNIEF